MVTNPINLAPESPGCRTSGFFQKSASGKRATPDGDLLLRTASQNGLKRLNCGFLGLEIAYSSNEPYWIFNGSVRRTSPSPFAFSVISKLISSKCHGRKS
jgi:hypothetical protein